MSGGGGEDAPQRVSSEVRCQRAPEIHSMDKLTVGVLIMRSQGGKHLLLYANCVCVCVCVCVYGYFSSEYTHVYFRSPSALKWLRVRCKHVM